MRAVDISGMKRPPAGDNGRPCRLEWLPIFNLVIDPDYQRPIGRANIKAIERIAAAFNWSKFSTVVVAPVADRRFAIIDGQHRVHAAKLVGLDAVPCQILDLTQAEQAASFSAINGSVTKVTPLVVYRAALAAGEQWALSARHAVESAGCRLMTSNRATAKRQAGELYAVNSIRDLVAKYGGPVVTAALEAYRLSVYGDLPTAWGNIYIQAWIAAVGEAGAAGKFTAPALARFHDDFDILEADDRVVEQIKQIRRDGGTPGARWALLRDKIADILKWWRPGTSEAAE